MFGASIDYTVEHFEPTDRATTREHRPKNAMPACQERVDSAGSFRALSQVAELCRRAERGDLISFEIPDDN